MIPDRKVEKFDIGFENCQVMEFSPDDILGIRIVDIQRGIYNFGQRFCQEQLTAEHVVIWFKKEFREKYKKRWEEIAKETGGATLELLEDPFNRITAWSDITSIGVKYDNGETEDIYCPWEDDKDKSDGWGIYPNKLQHSELDEEGALKVVISKTKTIKDFF